MSSLEPLKLHEWTEGTLPPWLLAFPLSDHEVFGSETKRNTGKETITSILGEWGPNRTVEMPITKMVGVFLSKVGHAFDAKKTVWDIIDPCSDFHDGYHLWILNTTIVARFCHQACSPKMWPMYGDEHINCFSKHVVAVMWMLHIVAACRVWPHAKDAASLHPTSVYNVRPLLLHHMENCSIELISLAQAIAVCIEITLL